MFIYILNVFYSLFYTLSKHSLLLKDDLNDIRVKQALNSKLFELL